MTSKKSAGRDDEGKKPPLKPKEGLNGPPENVLRSRDRLRHASLPTHAGEALTPLFESAWWHREYAGTTGLGRSLH